MKENETCPKCGSTEIIPDVRVVTPGLSDLNAVVYENPDALVFKAAEYRRLSARVCGECGYSELYVSEPGELLAAYRASRQGG